MKKIYLMRHSILERRNCQPSSCHYRKKAKSLSCRKKTSFIILLIDFCSPYKRALETAKLMTDQVEVVNELHERIIGDASEDFGANSILTIIFEIKVENL